MSTSGYKVFQGIYGIRPDGSRVYYPAPPDTTSAVIRGCGIDHSAKYQVAVYATRRPKSFVNSATGLRVVCLKDTP